MTQISDFYYNRYKVIPGLTQTEKASSGGARPVKRMGGMLVKLCSECLKT